MTLMLAPPLCRSPGVDRSRGAESSRSARTAVCQAAIWPLTTAYLHAPARRSRASAGCSAPGERLYRSAVSALTERRYAFVLVDGCDRRHARHDTYLEGDAMAKSLLPVTCRSSTARRRPGWSMSPGRCAPARAGHIGPIRREIIFEPLHEKPTPVEAPPVAPEPQPQEPREPMPDRT
jgi:hypothetical protein